MLGDQTHRLGPRVVVLLRHGCHLPNQGGVHQTRDGSHTRTPSPLAPAHLKTVGHTSPRPSVTSLRESAELRPLSMRRCENAAPTRPTPVVLGPGAWVAHSTGWRTFVNTFGSGRDGLADRGRLLDLAGVTSLFAADQWNGGKRSTPARANCNRSSRRRSSHHSRLWQRSYRRRLQ